MILTIDDKRNRDFIEPEHYEEIFDSQRTISFTGTALSVFSSADIEKRIAELEQLEQDKKFVFVGEKHWLKKFLEESRNIKFSRYHQWVKFQLIDVLGIKFSLSPFSVKDDFPKECWLATVDVSTYLIKSDKLDSKQFEIDTPEELELMVCGNNDGISPAHLIKLYEYLHDYEYIIGRDVFKNRNADFLYVGGFGVTNIEEPNKWDLYVDDSSGSGGTNLNIQYRQLWRS